MSCPVNKIDSNNTGLRFAEEECLRILPQGAEAFHAAGVLTLTGKGEEDDTFEIGGRTYTLRNTFDADTNEIIIGATAAETAERIEEALNSGYSAGASSYIGMGTSASDDVIAVAKGATVEITAQDAGDDGNLIDTSATGSELSFAEAFLTGGADAVDGDIPVWNVLEPNSYSDFGGQIATVARNPINPSRQRKKGVTTDLDASGGFNQDLTLNNTTRLLQGFFFADLREKKTTAPMNGERVAFTGVTGVSTTYTAASGLSGFRSGQLVLATGFGLTANNGLRKVASNSLSSSVQVTGSAMADEASPPATAKLETVGYEFLASSIAMTLQGNLVRMTSSDTDLTTLGIIEGEWLFVGGDGAGKHFAVSHGFARVSDVQAGYIEFDKVAWKPTAESGTGLSVQIFFGSVLRNEDDPELIKRRTYQLERTLGRDGDGMMSEYLVGAVPNELTLNIAQADKVNIDMSFVAVDNEQRSGAQGMKYGQRPVLESSDAFNTSSDFNRIKLASVTNNAAPDALFAFATEMSITINNNVTPNKAIGVLGAFDTSAGTFEVGGSLTAYFANVEAVQAVRNNEDITLDIIMLKRNAGMLFDVPLLSLGDGRLSVEQDQPITVPLETNAAESKYGHTLLFQSFPYLPNAAG